MTRLDDAVARLRSDLCHVPGAVKAALSNGVPTDASGTAAAAASTTATYRLPRPSLHLSWSELSCHDGTDYPPPWEDRAVVLAGEFEAIRTACGNHPLLILSAYRTPEYNKRCGGVPLSQHVQGKALDIQVRAGWTEDQMFKAIRDVALRTQNGARVSAIRGIGRYPGRHFFHVDIRESHDLVIWEGKHVHYLPCE